jgi:hypothetical protein
MTLIRQSPDNHEAENLYLRSKRAVAIYSEERLVFKSGAEMAARTEARPKAPPLRLKAEINFGVGNNHAPVSGSLGT